MNVSHNDINNIVQSELVADMARMILFFVIYGSLPHLLQPSQHHYARSEERSRVRVLLKYSWQMVMMSLVCVYWKGRMRADLPNTAETPIQNYMFYFFIAAIVGDVHFYAVHKLLHWNRYLYKHVHSHHHTMPSSDMEPLDYIDQHPLEMFLSVMPIAYLSYIAPIVPSWYTYHCIYFVHGMGLAAHSMLNYYDVTNVLFYVFLPFSFPLVMISLATRILGLPNILSSPSRHFMHHEDSRVNFGLMFTFMDRWFGTEQSYSDKSSRPIPNKSKRHEISILLTVLQLFVTLTTKSLYTAYTIYCINLVIEMVNPRTNKFLRTVHHPLALVLACSAFVLGLDGAAAFVVVSNIVQLPSFFALATGRYCLLAAWIVTPIKLMVGVICIANLSPWDTFLDKLQILPIVIGVAMQVKGGLDLAAKTRQPRGSLSLGEKIGKLIGDEKTASVAVTDEKVTQPTCNVTSSVPQQRKMVRFNSKSIVTEVRRASSMYPSNYFYTKEEMSRFRTEARKIKSDSPSDESLVQRVFDVASCSLATVPFVFVGLIAAAIVCLPFFLLLKVASDAVLFLQGTSSQGDNVQHM